MLERKEYMLFTIGAAKEQGLSPVQLQKALFLLAKSGAPSLPSDFYEFVPYNYGPFTPLVYEDASKLANEGLIAQTSFATRSWPYYKITERGQNNIEEVAKQISPQVQEYIQEVVNWVKGLSFSDLLRAIYANFPEYRVNSIFQG